MFIDEAEIYVEGGKGGHGCMSFRREKYRPLGGPDGGDGGNGGSVIFRAAPSVATLHHLKGRHHWRAESGRPGEGNDRAGRNGIDLTVDLPVGTLVYDRETGVLLKDLARPEETCCVAKGGSGGRGNKAFATATQQAPRHAEPGEPGEARELRLTLKLIADAGLVGLPNAGKSTLLSRLSAARPKIAAYPFTTLEPQLGIAELSDDRRIVLADIPGLIEGAHEGAGLGDAFLRHIERTRVIIHVIDVCPIDEHSPAEDYGVIRAELEKHSMTLAGKPEIVVANKIDLAASLEPVEALSREIAREVLPISAATGRGLERLIEAMWAMVAPFREAPVQRYDLGRPPHERSDA